MSSGSSDRDLYDAFVPSQAAALAFTILFALSAAGHIGQMVSKRAWWMWPFVVGVLGEVAGYACRYVSARNPTDSNAWLAQMLLIILSPNFLAALDYILFARLMLYVAPHLSTLPPRWVGAIFITCDVISLMLQGGGGGSLGSVRTPSSLRRAKAILIAGLVFQLVTFTLFTLSAALFYYRTRRPTDHPIHQTHARPAKGRWQWVLAALFGSSGLIITRSVFRLIEFCRIELGAGEQGSRSFVRKEWIIYFLEAAPILLACLLFNLIHPSFFGQIPNDKSRRFQTDLIERQLHHQGSLSRTRGEDRHDHEDDVEHFAPSTNGDRTTFSTAGVGGKGTSSGSALLQGDASTIVGGGDQRSEKELQMMEKEKMDSRVAFG